MSDRLGRIDQFESVFKSADKPVFQLHEVEFGQILVITDHSREESSHIVERARAFLKRIDRPFGAEARVPEWGLLTKEDFSSVDDCRRRIDERHPDLVVAWRNLFDPVGASVYSLGVFVDELTQYLRPPVLLLPDPKLNVPLAEIETVMVVTNRLTGEDRLVNKGVRFTPPDGRLVLSHLEDEAIFDRYMRVIERIPEINSEIAREAIRRQLLKEPSDYISSCIEVIQSAGLSFGVDSIVEFGHGAADFKRLVEANGVDLMIFFTKDESQIAMQGMAYSLAVEIRNIPLLML